MAARAGMIDLITRIRRMVNDGNASVWEDDELQAVMDAHVEHVRGFAAIITPEQTGPGEVVYRDYHLPLGDLEGTASGTANWRVFDSTGTTIDPDGYTLYPIEGRVRFDEDQEGSVRYVNFRSYDLHAAAADLWEERAGQVSDRYSFSEPGRSFSRSDWFRHCTQMAEYHKRQRRVVTAELYRSDMGEGRWV